MSDQLDFPSSFVDVVLIMMVFRYYDVTLKNGKVVKDAIWWYKYPTYESIQIAGRLCFYNEKVDVFIDGIKQ